MKTNNPDSGAAPGMTAAEGINVSLAMNKKFLDDRRAAAESKKPEAILPTWSGYADLPDDLKELFSLIEAMGPNELHGFAFDLEAQAKTEAGTGNLLKLAELLHQLANRRAEAGIVDRVSE